MKIRFIVVATALGIATSHAASLTILNFTPGDTAGNDLAVLDSGGNALVSGFYGLYLFGTEGSSIPPNASELKENGNTGLLKSLGIAPGANTADNGAFSALFDDFTNPNLNDNLYFVAGSGADASSSTELLLVHISELIDPSSSEGNPEVLGHYVPRQGDVEIGTIGDPQTFNWASQNGESPIASIHCP